MGGPRGHSISEGHKVCAGDRGTRFTRSSVVAVPYRLGLMLGELATINHQKPRSHSYHRNGQRGVAAFVVTMNGHRSEKYMATGLRVELCHKFLVPFSIIKI